MTRRRALTYAEAWAIVCAPDTDAETLARQLQVNASSIRNARARYRRRGWSCRVAYVPCRGCGGSLVQRVHSAGRAAWHDGCRPDARRAIQHRLNRDLWERMHPAARDAVLERAHDATAAQQAATITEATNAGARWSAADDAYLVTHWHAPAHAVGLASGRSLCAVKARKMHHRRQGTAP